MTLPADDELDVTLLERYCSDTASANEQARIEAWFARHPGERAWYENFKGTVQQGHPVMTEARVNVALAEFLRTLFERDQRAGTSKSIGSLDRVPAQRRRWSLAAACAVAVLASVLTWKNAGVRLFRPSSTPRVTYTTYATTLGQRATITLPDSNTVVLNVGSRLEVPTNYGAGNHVVRLADGEALFTVVHHTGTPFVVTAGAVKARVLGTTFLVRHYERDTVATVAVGEGKVAVGSTIVTAHRLVEIGQRGTPHVRVSDDALFTFATGTLTIDGLSLPDAIVELDRWYNADIRLGDPALASRHVNASFSAGSVNELAENLGALYNVRVVREGRVLILNPK